MMRLTGFADEISDDLNEQLDVLAAEGMACLELRSVWKKKAAKLTDEEVATIKTTLDARGFKVSSIGSAIGKTGIEEEFDSPLAEFRRVVQIARQLEAPYIRIFSFLIPKEASPSDYRAQVMNRLGQLARIAEDNQVTLVLENDNGMYGTTDERAKDIFNEVRSSRLRAAFDPGNFVINDISPMSAYSDLFDDIEYIHVKDAIRTSRMFVPAGEGDGEFKALIAALKSRRFSGFLSIEPHLKHRYPDKSGPERFRIAAQAIKQLLAEEGIAWQ